MPSLPHGTKARTIDAHIESFLALDYPNIELILCAGGSDDTLARAQCYAGDRVQVIAQVAGEGKQKALARAYPHATGDIIFLTDADCLYDSAALTHLLAPIINDGEAIASGTFRLRADQHTRLLPFYVCAANTVSSGRTGRYTDGLLGANTAMTRAALDHSGGMDFTAATGTDYHFG